MAGQLRKVLFEHTVNVQRLDENTVDERGEKSDTWSNHIVNVPCRIVEQNEVENRSGRNTVLKNFIIYCHGNRDIKASDRLQDTTDNTLYYEIDSLRKSHSRDGRVLAVTITAHTFE
jgi:head-tail adaptor|tara:strand:- start:5132 stop:5482 length:351 start_codon:yes stop_codon:yes gene_type:complete